MTYLFATILLILVIILRSPKIKGMIGESSVRHKLGKLNPKEYTVMHDIMIQRPDGKTSQIDHVVVSRYGVFVIETKNYTGWIVGGEKSEYWTQVIYKRKERLYNPIRQNYGHVKALESFLEDETIPFISIIAFSTRADLKLEPMSIDVVYTTRLVSTIQKYKNVRLSEDQKDRVHKALSVKTLHTREERKKHVADIKGNLKEKAALASAGICPRCNGKLVERRGKSGMFMGCSSYPRCRFTKVN
ncbi:NERD domain-containing protein [Cohnella hashimotonis]|uniref:NERD domain-containing protein n=1 Tax=Cohnella hashimotonis TaxID=2826895 RepID=A0ABT6TPM7_9BACL|nr:NERD domain-containing protein [Cohnella hashimotonis]MDI4648780.1 NERD domain-containing protein [Cohnella hashimotonis]